MINSLNIQFLNFMKKFINLYKNNSVKTREPEND
jgi:hypothetical protein